MAYEMQIRGTQSEVKVRSPWAAALLPIITLGIYHLVWWYKINKELKAYGEAKGYDLGQNPTNSVLALFPGGISKRHLPDSLEVFVRETRRAELAHWWALAAGPVFALWNPPLGVVLMVLYGIVVNAPFIAIQRYNRARAQRLLHRRARH